MDIYKAGAVIVRDRHVLVARTLGKDIFMTPGGKIEPGETDWDSLLREVDEEVKLDLTVCRVEPFGHTRRPAAERAGFIVDMSLFLVRDCIAEPIPSREIEEVRWVNSQTNGVLLSSVVQLDIIPPLVASGLID